MAKRILVIEDEAAIRDLICMNLEVAGYETVVFGDGIEVSEALKKVIIIYFQSLNVHCWISCCLERMALHCCRSFPDIRFRSYF